MTNPQPSGVDEALDAAPILARALPLPGSGDTAGLWETLSDIASDDLGAARTIEPHLDAVAILTQADQPALIGEYTWGVFAAEGGDRPVTFADGVLNGVKPWCSLADRLGAALVTAHVGEDRQLFAVSLTAPGVTTDAAAWHARGLAEIPSGPVTFDNVPAVPVGEPGWYLTRPGFEWGAMAVAACWHGGAIGVGRTVFAAMRDRPNPHGLAHLGAIDELLQSSRRALAEGASRVDDGTADRLLAKRVRATVARVVDEVIVRAGRALGPAPLALDESHAKRVADLELYVRQYHAERDQESLGRGIVAEGVAPW